MLVFHIIFVISIGILLPGPPSRAHKRSYLRQQDYPARGLQDESALLRGEPSASFNPRLSAKKRDENNFKSQKLLKRELDFIKGCLI
ncbi:hypothetical protein AYB33_15870 [Leptospira santarosai]|nr:hypothetical protein AYB33_15870 [Leptospira santarosai]